MIGAERAAVDLMLSYLSTNPVEKLPLMLSLAERLDRGGLHRSQIRGYARPCWTRAAYGGLSLRTCSATSTSR